jgi:hypothetical protein
VVILDLDSAAQVQGYEQGMDMLNRLARKRRFIITPGKQGKVYARLDWGRWIADCPFCKGAEYVSRVGRLFFCLSCGMKDNGGHPMHAVFPRDLQEIEASAASKSVEFQNWRRGVE